MSQDSKQFIYNKIETIWAESGAWPEFIEAMRLALPGDKAPADSIRDPARWALLPDYCCQAAGGEKGRARDIAAAWFLLFMAAHLYDGIQDQDSPDPWWKEIGAGAAVNAASGLLLSGLLILNNLHNLPEMNLVAGDICAHFYHQGFTMSSGQHQDLISKMPSLEEWFKIAEAKSGAFFALGCWAGARLATSDVERLDCFAQFGSHLGVLLQIHDDLSEIEELKHGQIEEPLKCITRSLPVAYALEVCPEGSRKQLFEFLGCITKNSGATREVFDLLNKSGAAIYLKLEIERRQELAQTALDLAKPNPSVRDTLLSFLRTFEWNDVSGKM